MRGCNIYIVVVSFPGGCVNIVVIVVTIVVHIVVVYIVIVVTIVVHIVIVVTIVVHIVVVTIVVNIVVVHIVVVHIVVVHIVVVVIIVCIIVVVVVNDVIIFISATDTSQIHDVVTVVVSIVIWKSYLKQPKKSIFYIINLTNHLAHHRRTQEFSIFSNFKVYIM